MAEIRLLGWCFKAVRVCMQLKSCRETKTLRARTGEKRPPRHFGTHLFQRQKWMNNKQIVEKRSERGRGLKQLSSHRQSRRRSLQPTPDSHHTGQAGAERDVPALSRLLSPRSGSVVINCKSCLYPCFPTGHATCLTAAVSTAEKIHFRFEFSK